jgi:hypothetical protein
MHLRAEASDLLGNRRLSSHGINRHRRLSQIQQRQQRRNGSDFVGFLAAHHRSQRHPEICRPRRHQMQTTLSTRIARAAQQLAVDGNVTSPDHLMHRLRQPKQRVCEGIPTTTRRNVSWPGIGSSSGSSRNSLSQSRRSSPYVSRSSQSCAPLSTASRLITTMLSRNASLALARADPSHSPGSA